jgi:predicted acyltransferase
MVRQIHMNDSFRTSDTDITHRTITSPVRERVTAIDALRGFDMFWIVGGQELALALAASLRSPTPKWLEYHLEHVEWVGFSAWDLIMPLFLFVVGAAMPFSLLRRVEEGVSKVELCGKMIRRCAILYLLGMVVQGNLLDFNASTLHLFSNTLQSIAAGYLVAGILILNVGIIGQTFCTAALLIGYWALLTQVPFSGHAAGVLEPNANVAMAVDEYILGPYRDGTTYTWILSGMTFSASVLLGVFAGHVLRGSLSQASKVVTLCALGTLCLVGGYAWATWLGFPIIKHIWTSSMVLWAAGWSFLLLALFYLLIDVIGWRRWAFFFTVIGMNAITIYVASFFIPFQQISESLVGGLASHTEAAGSVIVAATSVGLVWLVLYHLYREKIFVRV